MARVDPIKNLVTEDSSVWLGKWRDSEKFVQTSNFPAGWGRALTVALLGAPIVLFVVVGRRRTVAMPERRPPTG
jgi:hypothetical protein